jgi:hypothetical protein
MGSSTDWLSIEHRVILTNQNIVELAYLTKEMIEPLIKSRKKVVLDQADCYVACFNLCRRLLKNVDCGGSHQNLKEFYRAERELSNDWDRLSWCTPKELRDRKEESGRDIPF